MKQQIKVVVAGAGVIGLTTALSLLRAGIKTRIVAETDWTLSCSGAAAAFWYPYHAEPLEKVARWGAHSLDIFKKLAQIEGSGVAIHRMLEVSKTAKEKPWWAQIVDNFAIAAPHELPANYTTGYWFDTPIIDATIYMPYLLEQIKKLGVGVEHQLLKDWAELANDEEIVVNCTGIGAKKLCADDDLKSGKGQVLSIKKAESARAVVDSDGDVHFAHITPRFHDTIIGGIYIENDFELLPSPIETEGIIDRCNKLFPNFKVNQSDILRISCGLRPVRSSVRLEAETTHIGQTIVHNYGHGGAGYTLSWGCAADVTELLLT